MPLSYEQQRRLARAQQGKGEFTPNAEATKEFAQGHVDSGDVGMFFTSAPHQSTHPHGYPGLPDVSRDDE
jgi:hypothetical protein